MSERAEIVREARDLIAAARSLVAEWAEEGIESFVGIPGLGSYMLDAIKSQDFAIVRSMVFIGSILYIVGLILTDISYTWADPRVRLN